MTELTTSIKHFAFLKRAPSATWTEATKCKALHKPLLLLAVLDLVCRGVITSPFIAVSGDLVELNELEPLATEETDEFRPKTETC